jgi:Rrf2 family nitric oxide-sensitive transcriptional repressor
MRLTSFTDYGMRALMRLAGTPERRFSTEEIASEFGISRNHLTKVIRRLAEAGYVITHRGTGGGFQLADSPDQVSIGSVIRLLEDHQPLVECFQADGGTCILTPNCRLKSKLASAREAFMAELDKTTLAECAYPSNR